jgi:hypothetical protein
LQGGGSKILRVWVENDDGIDLSQDPDSPLSANKGYGIGQRLRKQSGRMFGAEQHGPICVRRFLESKGRNGWRASLTIRWLNADFKSSEVA